MDPNTLLYSKYFKKIFRFTSTYLIKVVGVCDRDVLIKQHEFIIKILSLFVQKLVFLSDLYTENASWITNKDLPCLEYLSGLCKKNTFSVLVPIFITGLPRVIITYQRLISLLASIYCFLFFTLKISNPFFFFTLRENKYPKWKSNSCEHFTGTVSY